MMKKKQKEVGLVNNDDDDQTKGHFCKGDRPSNLQIIEASLKSSINFDLSTIRMVGETWNLSKNLHDRQSWRSRQISSLGGGDTGEGDDEVDDGNGDGKDFRDDIDGDQNNFDYDDTCAVKDTLNGLKTLFLDQKHLTLWLP